MHLLHHQRDSTIPPSIVSWWNGWQGRVQPKRQTRTTTTKLMAVVVAVEDWWWWLRTLEWNVDRCECEGSPPCCGTVPGYWVGGAVGRDAASYPRREQQQQQQHVYHCSGGWWRFPDRNSWVAVPWNETHSHWKSTSNCYPGNWTSSNEFEQLCCGH